MYLSKLNKILIPPSKAVVDEPNWTLLEDLFNIAFPRDFKEFTACYGVGQIGNFININVPFLPVDDYLKEVNYLCSNYSDSKCKFPDKYTFSIYPEKNGLFPLGSTDNGDELWWLMNSDPEKWEIVIYASRSWDFCKYPMGFVEFLYKYLTKEIKCEIFPSEIPTDNPEFSTL